MSTDNQQLKKVLGPITLWGLGVGYVISGMYFGWNLGLVQGGTLGMAAATIFTIILYITFTLSYTELACAIPKAGGAFDYARVALGKNFAFIAGAAQSIEFIFAPPAIAAAIGAYFHLFIPQVDVVVISIVAYLVFTLLNIFGMRSAAYFELVITILAVAELLIFSGVSFTAFEWKNLTQNNLPNGWKGAFAAIPFAIWFFLGLEAIANVAEETENPQKSILRGFGSALVTLVFLCILTFVSAVGVAGWEAIVYARGSTTPSDSPLPLALFYVVGANNFLYHLLLTIGLLGLVASFNGILLAAGRSTLELGRAGFIPAWIGNIHHRTRTPVYALVINMAIGIIALLTGKTGDIIIIACFGALTLYMVSMVSFFALRKKVPGLERPFKAPFYPVFPLIALIFSAVAFISMSIYYSNLLIIFLVICAGMYPLFLLHQKSQKHTL